jgi:citrate synthase
LGHLASVNSLTDRINIDSINIDSIKGTEHTGHVSTLIRSGETAAILGVTKATLYAYVSRGRLARTIAADGRTSLFARDEVEQLAQRSRRTPTGPRATIDVQISSGITVIDEASLSYRGHDVAALVVDHRFEDVAELLWSGESVETSATWPSLDAAERGALAPIASLRLSPIGRIATAAQVLAELDGGVAVGETAGASTIDAARRLLIAAPPVLGSTRRSGRYAERLAAAWRRRPSPALVDAIDAALVLLADHELATSTLAVRIAASVRTSPSVALAAGLTTLEGALHGSASAEAHRFLDDCGESAPSVVMGRLRAQRRPIPGFGHKIYRGVDPRFSPLLDQVRRLDPAGAELVDGVIVEAGRIMAHQPNVDLALGALTRAAGFEPDTPIFAVARIAGWAAHYDEECAERPVRFRGVATPRR